MKKRRVLVIGEDTFAFLATVRSLGRAGVDVHVACCPMDAPALRSRYVKKIHQIPPYRSESDDWILAFQDILRQETFDLVLPLVDTAILPLQLHRAKFELLARFCLLPDDVYFICSDKLQTYDLAIKEGVPVALQHVVSNADEALQCAKVFGYPIVLKPRQSVANKNPAVRQVVRKARNEQELLELATQMTADQAVLAQENFIGHGVGVEVLCKNGDILTAFQHERVHEPMMGGGSSYRKSVALHDGMYAATSRLMKALRYTGVAMVEFKHNHASDQWMMVEINARFWGSLPLSIAAGLDFPTYLCQMLLEDRTDFPRGYRNGVFSRNWSKDMDWFIANLRADRSDPLLHSRPLGSVLLEVKNVLLLREYSDTLSLDDPRPAAADLAQFVGEKAFRILKMLKVYRLIERRRLFRLYQSANRVLLMCYGNICRSPFAARLLTRLDRSKTVTSAGTYPQSLRKSPTDAIAASTVFGVDLASHSSEVASTEKMRSVDLIVVFDRRNWLAVRAMCPEIMDRVAYLGAADPDQALEIADPYGGGVEQFRGCYQRIQKLLQRLVEASGIKHAGGV